MEEILRERVAVNPSPTAAYRRVGGSALLEPAERGWQEPLVAADPVASFRYRRGDANPTDGDAGDESQSGDGLTALREWLSSVGISLGAAGEAWRSETAAGAFGYIGYDIVAEMETLPGETERDIDLPDIAFDLYDTVLRFEDDAVVVEAVEHEHQERPAAERVADFAERLRSEPSGAERGSALAGEPTPGGIDASAVTSNFSRAAYERAVETVKERVREGDTFQANVSQRLGFRTEADPLSLYAALRESNPAPYMGLLAYDGYAVVSTSPELLLRKEGQTLRTRPIAGTRPRGEDGDEDAALRAELTASEKERAEHSILVDLVRNDLGAVSRHGSVSVEEFLETVPYTGVQHLESVITGELRADRDLIDALGSVFPGGTVTGAPKPRTLAIIDEVEPTERGPYTGSMGRIGFDGDATLNILIRTVVCEGERHYLQVGGGVVHDSEPAREYEETLDKASAMLDALATEDPLAGLRAETTTDRGVEAEATEGEAAASSAGEDTSSVVAPSDAVASGPRARRDDDVRIAVVDNYDSFAGNLQQYLGEFADVEMRRYESVPEADGIVLSPGPGRPEEFPVMYDVLERTDAPVLGVCLGHQAIADHFGGTVGYAGEVVHGKRSPVEHDDTGVFAGLPSPMPVARYHSLVVTEVPDDLAVVARGAGEVMGLTHRRRPIYGVQFHPESVLTPDGRDLVRNFVDIVRRHREDPTDLELPGPAELDPGPRPND